VRDEIAVVLVGHVRLGKTRAIEDVGDDFVAPGFVVFIGRRHFLQLGLDPILDSRRLGQFLFGDRRGRSNFKSTPTMLSVCIVYTKGEVKGKIVISHRFMSLSLAAVPKRVGGV